jgi:hypothetical protein
MLFFYYFVSVLGSKIRWLRFDGIRITEIKRLLGPGASLDSLGRACKLDQVKGHFPFGMMTSAAFLEEPHLPPLASDWESSLNPSKNPSQAQVDEHLAFYRASGFSKIGQFLDWYLSIDVTILLKAVLEMKKKYFSILQLDFIDSKKFTVSSFSSAGAQHFLARRKRPGQFVCNHRRIFRVRI